MAYTKEDPTDWAIFQHPEEASDDDDTTSHTTDHWQGLMKAKST